MLSSTPLNLRRAAVAAALVLTAAIAAPGAALAADAPTLGAPTIIPAGQKTPIDVGGNHLYQGDIIRKGTALVRWPVALHGDSKAPITLSCPDGSIHSGLGLQEGSDVAFAVLRNSSYYRRTIDVRFYTLRDVDPSTATGHVYALCRDTAIAPMPPAIAFPTIRKAGQRSPVDVAGNHLHRGARIAAGAQLLRFPVTLRGDSRRTVTLDCPRGTVHRGLGSQEGSRLVVTLWNRYGRRAMRVSIHPRHGVSANGTTGSIYALCG
jgi:hypothetical protein